MDPATFSKALKIFLVIVLVVAVTLFLLTGRAIYGLGLCLIFLPFIFRWTSIRRKEKITDQTEKKRSTEQKETKSSFYEFDTPMTVEEAQEILGVDDPFTEADVQDAHKHMIKRVHPDQGGSTYLAQQINEAKDVLLRVLKKGSV